MKNVTTLEIMVKAISKLTYILKLYDIIVFIYKYISNNKLLGTKHKLLMNYTYLHKIILVFWSILIGLCFS